MDMMLAVLSKHVPALHTKATAFLLSQKNKFAGATDHQNHNTADGSAIGTLWNAFIAAMIG
jgi:hypothetical protein